MRFKKNQRPMKIRLYKVLEQNKPRRVKKIESNNRGLPTQLEHTPCSNPSHTAPLHQVKVYFAAYSKQQIRSSQGPDSMPNPSLMTPTVETIPVRTWSEPVKKRTNGNNASERLFSDTTQLSLSLCNLIGCYMHAHFQATAGYQ